VLLQLALWPIHSAVLRLTLGLLLSHIYEGWLDPWGWNRRDVYQRAVGPASSSSCAS